MPTSFLKTLFFVFLFFIYWTNTSSEEINSWNELVRKGNIFYKKSDNKHFSGILKNYYPSGKLSLIDNFKNGMQHGEFKSFYENGKILMSGIFKKGKQHGQWKEFHEDGSIYWKLNYYDGIELSTKMVRLCQKLHILMGSQILTGFTLMSWGKK